MISRRAGAGEPSKHVVPPASRRLAQVLCPSGEPAACIHASAGTVWARAREDARRGRLLWPLCVLKVEAGGRTLGQPHGMLVHGRALLGRRAGSSPRRPARLALARVEDSGQPEHLHPLLEPAIVRLQVHDLDAPATRLGPAPISANLVVGGPLHDALAVHKLVEDHPRVQHARVAHLPLAVAREVEKVLAYHGERGIVNELVGLEHGDEELRLGERLFGIPIALVEQQRIHLLDVVRFSDAPAHAHVLNLPEAVRKERHRHGQVDESDGLFEHGEGKEVAVAHRGHGDHGPIERIDPRVLESPNADDEANDEGHEGSNHCAEVAQRVVDFLIALRGTQAHVHVRVVFDAGDALHHPQDGHLHGLSSGPGDFNEGRDGGEHYRDAQDGVKAGE
mmetsp:Transcript_25359/g.74462  ORF Transcript_25359/g.74462 Transcript_25359/m.74462 type:complete len:393 (+) Transcript_25359:302-1480(+)